MLSTILLIEQGYQVFLVHYDNSFEVGSNNIQVGVKRLVKKYGSDKIKYIGTKKYLVYLENLLKIFII